MVKKKAGSGAPLPKSAPAGPVQPAIERDVQEMLTANDNGEIDNVFDIVDELTDYEERLPANSALRPAWDEFHAECMKIMVESAGE